MQIETLKKLIVLESNINRYEQFLKEIQKYQPFSDQPIRMVSKPDPQEKQKVFYVPQTSLPVEMHKMIHGGPVPDYMATTYPPPVSPDYVSVSCFLKSTGTNIPFNISPEVMNTEDIFEFAKTCAQLKLHAQKDELQSHFAPPKPKLPTSGRKLTKAEKEGLVAACSPGLLTPEKYNQAKELLFVLNNAITLLHDLQNNTHDYFELKEFMGPSSKPDHDFEEVDFVRKTRLFNEEKACLEKVIRNYRQKIEWI